MAYMRSICLTPTHSKLCFWIWLPLAAAQNSGSIRWTDHKLQNLLYLAWMPVAAVPKKETAPFRHRAWRAALAYELGPFHTRERRLLDCFRFIGGRGYIRSIVRTNINHFADPYPS
ncbi:hypothetical protein LshimejAT787_0100810 [Lyophyllum shimeji]|uniref:Secreted protein n=1 Tax=Lyophyllum shimeji TaxID=47721 RepID=A0A9P3PD09_LYOSH|nr:hypothetical protein LshimejAT787_0100810 [Lyophyllum shimeji]